MKVYVREKEKNVISNLAIAGLAAMLAGGCATPQRGNFDFCDGDIKERNSYVQRVNLNELTDNEREALRHYKVKGLSAQDKEVVRQGFGFNPKKLTDKEYITVVRGVRRAIGVYNK